MTVCGNAVRLREIHLTAFLPVAYGWPLETSQVSESQAAEQLRFRPGLNASVDI
jgi:hypothetical protein